MNLQGITEDDIAEYLVNTPAFFERHAELMASVQLTSPHGQRAVSLQERQMEMLRERIKGLEARIAEMIRNGQANAAIAERLQRWTRALLVTADAAALPGVLVDELRREFGVPQAALRLWGLAPGHEGEPYAAPVGDDAKRLAAGLAQPYCGVDAGFAAVGWLPEPAAAASVALIALRSGDRTFGLLVLASPDATRFAAGIGTEFLGRIGDTAAAALSRLLP